MNININCPPCSQGQELLRASDVGDMATVTSLLQNGADVYFMDEVYTFVNFTHACGELASFPGLCGEGLVRTV